MAFTSITSSEIMVGEPAKNETMTKIKDNFDNHESRIGALEVGSNISYPPMIFELNGDISTYAMPQNNFIFLTTNFSVRILGCILIIKNAGGSGTTEIRIRRFSSGSWSNILLSNASVASGAGNMAQSSNAVVDSSNNVINAGEIIGLDIISAQASGKDFLVRIDYEKV